MHIPHFISLFISSQTFFANVNNTSMKISVQVFMQTFVYICLGYILRNGIDESYDKFIFNILKKLTFPKCLYQFKIPLAIYENLNNFTSLPALFIVCHFSILAILVRMKWFVFFICAPVMCFPGGSNGKESTCNA